MRFSDKCKCGKPLLIGTAESIAPHLKQAGYVGTNVVVLHELPLCEDAEQEAADALAEVDHRAGDLKKREEERQKRIKAAIQDE